MFLSRVLLEIAQLFGINRVMLDVLWCFNQPRTCPCEFGMLHSVAYSGLVLSSHTWGVRRSY